jgi:hypothetical protein
MQLKLYCDTGVGQSRSGERSEFPQTVSPPEIVSPHHLCRAHEKTRENRTLFPPRCLPRSKTRKNVATRHMERCKENIEHRGPFPSYAPYLK